MLQDENSTNDVFCYQAHGRPVKNVKFSASKHDRLFSSSYDGVLRCCFFERGSFDEVVSEVAVEEASH